MTQYLELPRLKNNIAFPPLEVNNGLSEIFSRLGKKQLHIAESEKHAHVTYFFNCLRNNPFEGESDLLIESYQNIADHPEMRAVEIAEVFHENLLKNLYDFFVINLANADVSSHYGNLSIATKSIEHADRALGKIFESMQKQNGILLITADHGNAESMIYRGIGDAETKHNPNPVPFYLVMREYQRPRSEEEWLRTARQTQGIISDIAPTILELMGIKKPVEMTGDSLLPLLN
jgi:2,3-bisphosphoglycerate-independent phosphoglycerate mutase